MSKSFEVALLAQCVFICGIIKQSGK